MQSFSTSLIIREMQVKSPMRYYYIPNRMAERKQNRNSLVVQWLGLHASTAGGLGSIPGQGTKIPQASWWGQKQTNKQKPNDTKSWQQSTMQSNGDSHPLLVGVQNGPATLENSLTVSCEVKCTFITLPSNPTLKGNKMFPGKPVCKCL